MKAMMKKIRTLAGLTALALLLSSCGNISVTVSKAPGSANKDIVVLFTNDVHSGVDGGIGYAGVSAYKKKMIEEGNDVILVDNGDFVQGGRMGLITKGEAIIRIMNKVGYDIAVPGNHEFDYGVDQFFKDVEMSDFSYISCNFIDLRTGEKIFDPYIIRELGGKKVAFIGATTPSAITTATPKFFKDENGEYIYDFCGGSDSSVFYKAVQDAVDSARAEGADYCILIAHLGISSADAPYMSTDIIANTKGIDVVCDGHSHTVMEQEYVKNAEGKNVILAQTGSYLKNIGKLTIKPDGSMETILISDVEEKDESITEAIKKEEDAYADIINRVVVNSDFDLKATTEDGGWLIRNKETNFGDLEADAAKKATGAEIGLMNGDVVKSSLNKGEITYGDLLDSIHFGSKITSRWIKGQELLDALEYSVSFLPDDFGGFLQVSGLTFDVDLNKDAGVERDANRMFKGFTKDERRISNVKVNGEPIDPEREYIVGGNEYILFVYGNGYSMFTGERVDEDMNLLHIGVLEDYLTSFGGSIPSEYEESQERIHFIE